MAFSPFPLLSALFCSLAAKILEKTCGPNRKRSVFCGSSPNMRADLRCVVQDGPLPHYPTPRPWHANTRRMSTGKKRRVRARAEAHAEQSMLNLVCIPFGPPASRRGCRSAAGVPWAWALETGWSAASSGCPTARTPPPATPWFPGCRPARRIPRRRAPCLSTQTHRHTRMEHQLQHKECVHMAKYYDIMLHYYSNGSGPG